jgi:hypothetical protein
MCDPAAFAAIFDRHAAALHRFLARRVEPADTDSPLGGSRAFGAPAKSNNLG